MKQMTTLEKLFKTEQKLISIEKIQSYAFNNSTPSDCYMGRIKKGLKALSNAKTEKQLIDTWDYWNNENNFNDLTLMKNLNRAIINLKYAIQMQETYCIALDTEMIELLGYLIDHNIPDYIDNYLESNLEEDKGINDRVFFNLCRQLLNSDYDYMKMLESIQEQEEHNRKIYLQQALEELKEDKNNDK